MTLIAQKPHRTRFPAKIVTVRLCLHVLTVFWGVLEDFRWPPKVTHVMCINATFRVVRIFPIWTPARFISEHIESKNLQGFVNVVQIFV